MTSVPVRPTALKTPQLERPPEDRARRPLPEHDGPSVGAVQAESAAVGAAAVGADGAAAADPDAAAVAEDEALQRGDRQAQRADGEEGADRPVPPTVHKG